MVLTLYSVVVHDLFYGSRDHWRGIFARLARHSAMRPWPRGWPNFEIERECTYRRELDLETLVCTRDRAFPFSRLESRLRCPSCGNRRMIVMFEPPARAASATP
jgi:hypothetical protein